MKKYKEMFQVETTGKTGMNVMSKQLSVIDFESRLQNEPDWITFAIHNFEYTEGMNVIPVCITKDEAKQLIIALEELINN